MLKFERGEMERMAGKEIEYILTSTTSKHAANSGNADHNRILDKLFDSLRRTIAKSHIEGANPSEIIKNTPHYKLAQILKSVDNWHEFKDNVKEFLPSYEGNPRILLKLGGFDWKAASSNFTPPELRKFTKRGGNGSKPVPHEQIGDVILGNMEKSFKDLHDRIETLESENKQFKSLIGILIKKQYGTDLDDLKALFTFQEKSTVEVTE